MKKTFVGFGFGAIQSCLMVYEAQKSGNFENFIVSEVDRSIVDKVKMNRGRVSLNIASQKGLKRVDLHEITILNPNCPKDRAELAKAVYEADEMATAVPHINCYTMGSINSIASLLAENINGDKQQVLYTCENHNCAAEELSKILSGRMAGDKLCNFQVVNTVIGKMCSVVSSTEIAKKLELHPIWPHGERYLLCESFNNILISRIKLPGFTCGISVFSEKNDLLPYQEAKLFGHNAIHSLLGYLAHKKGYQSMVQVRNDYDLYYRAREAFLRESGASLIKKYAGLHDSRFSQQGFKSYADDLLRRMMNPYLSDEVSRICRDPGRKLGLNDRIFGAMKQALKQGIKPVHLAQAAFAALQYYLKAEKNEQELNHISRNPMRIKDIFCKLWQQPTLGYWDNVSVNCVIEASLNPA